MSELTMRPRGIGLNWLPCFVCGHGGGEGYPAQSDMASFVEDLDMGKAIVKLFDRVGFKAHLDTRRSDRTQVKLGACGEHLPNLHLVMLLARREPLTWRQLMLVRPGHKAGPYPASELMKADEMLARIK